jgi:hypothetical protein
MFALYVSSFASYLSQVAPLHGAGPSMPVPHWAVLLVVVPALWLLIGGAVLAVDRLLERLENESSN